MGEEFHIFYHYSVRLTAANKT